MPDFGLGDLIGTIGTGALDAAAPAADTALNILPDAAAFAPSAVGDVVAPAAEGLATGGLGLGGSGLGGAIGDSGLSVGGGIGSDAAAAPTNDAISSALGFAPSGTGGVGSDIVAAPVTQSGPITGPSSLSTPMGASPASPVGSAAGGGPTDLTSNDPTKNTSSGGGILDKLSPSSLATGAVNQVAKNPLGTLGGAALLGTAFMGNKQPTGASQLSSIAPIEAAAGLQNQQYLTTGTLPPAIKANVDQATAAAKQKIISNYAARGLPTDPSKNSSLAAELAQVDQNAIITTGQIGQQLLTSGLSQTGLGTDVYNKLVGIDQTNQANIQKALAAFAASMGGGGLKLNLGGSSTA